MKLKILSSTRAGGLMPVVKRGRNLAACLLLVVGSLRAFGVTPEKPRLESMYDQAFQDLSAGKYDEALKALDKIDRVQPDLAESWNLRGVVYMRQGNYPKAESALRKALSIEPKFWNARFNLAEIPFQKKDWPEARNRFEALMAADEPNLQTDVAQLIQYKILLTLILEGKQSTVDWMLNKFETAKNVPALYYSNAAIAFDKGKQKEAAEWVSAAQKHFPEETNKLYAESFYEIGWMQKPGGQPRAEIEIPSTADRANRLNAEAKANFEKAERAFQQRDFEGANRFLDQAEAAAPGDAATSNLRGEILLQRNDLDGAQAMFEKALRLNPKFREAQYNLAQIPFKQGDYEKARDRFESLFADTPGDEKNQAAQLLRYKIYLTLLMQGKKAEAQRLMDQFTFTGDTPALYYAHAAWEFKQGNNDHGADWMRAAERIYSPALNLVFLDSFYDLGWLKKGESTALTLASEITQISAKPSASPIMRLGPVDSLTAPKAAAQPNAGSSIAPVAGEAVATANPGSNPIQPAVSATPSASALNSAAPSAVESASATRPTSAAPQQKSRPTPAIAGAVAKPAPSVAPSRKRSDTSVAGPSAPAEERQSTSVSEMMPRDRDPTTLLIGTLLLLGIVVLVWIVVRQVWRDLVAVPAYESPQPETDRRVSGIVPELDQQGRPERNLISTRLPNPSVNLQAAEPPPTAPTAAAAPAADATEAEPPLPLQDVTSTPEERLRDGEPSATGIEAEEPEPTSEAIIPAMAAADAPVAEESAPDKPSLDMEKTEEEPAGRESIEQEQEPEEQPSLEAEEPPVSQGAPVPELTTALSAEAPIPELTQPETQTPLELLEPESDLAAPIAGHRPSHSDIETPSFAPKVIASEPIQLEPAGFETPAIPPAPTSPPPTPMPMRQPSEPMRTAVQLTFSLEIASVQLTPSLELSGLELRPSSRVVALRVARSEDPQMPTNLDVTCEITRVELSNGAISTIRLAPSAQQKPAVVASPTLNISGLELVSSQGPAPVQLTPAPQEQGSVHLTADFQIAAIEFTPRFEISAIVLNSTSNRVVLQLPGLSSSAVTSAPLFRIERVQLGPSSELGIIQVVAADRPSSAPDA